MPISPNDERYRTGGLFNFTKWSRENIPKDPPRYKVGDQVVMFADDEIKSIGQDCDGTVLYELCAHGFGWGESSLIPLPDDWDYEDDSNYEPIVKALRLQGWTVEPPVKP